MLNFFFPFVAATAQSNPAADAAPTDDQHEDQERLQSRTQKSSAPPLYLSPNRHAEKVAAQNRRSLLREPERRRLRHPSAGRSGSWGASRGNHVKILRTPTTWRFSQTESRPCHLSRLELSELELDSFASPVAGVHRHPRFRPVSAGRSAWTAGVGDRRDQRLASLLNV